MRSTGPDGTLTLDQAFVAGGIDLQANTLRARVFDVTPENGLDMRLSGVDGIMAETVEIDLRAVEGLTAGDVTISFGRFETAEISTQGPSLEARDVIVGTQAWFRQQDFDLYVTAAEAAIEDESDAQLLALEIRGGEMVAGFVEFALRSDRQLSTDKLVINRRLEDTGLNAVRTVYHDAMTELVLRFGEKDKRADTTDLERLTLFLQLLRRTNERSADANTLRFPLIIASNNE